MAAETALDKLKKLSKDLSSGKKTEISEEEASVRADEIIEKMKKSEGPVERGDLFQRKKILGLTTTRETVTKFDFNKLTLTGLSGGQAFLANIFLTFRVFLEKVAKKMSETPTAAQLKSLLESAGMNITPEAYLALASAVAFVSSVSIVILFAVLGIVFLDPTLPAIGLLAGVFVFVLAAFLALAYPVNKAEARAKQVDRALPFALRQIATQVKAGVSFNKALYSVSKAKYGVLSDEFNKLLNDIDRGLSTDEALTRLASRTRSKNLRKAVTQIVRALRTGGSLAQIISDIADDVSFETRMLIRDFTEKLNFINIVFIMIAVVAPVATTLMAAILQIPLFSSAVPGYFTYVAFLGITIASLIMLYIIKRMEPSAW